MTDKLPTLNYFVFGRNNNVALWIDKLEKRYAQISTHYPDRINDFVATIKSKSGPLYSSIKHKTSISEIFREIRQKYLSGTEAIDILFNIKSQDFKEALDTGKCLNNLENFLSTAELVIKHQLQILITAKQLDMITNTIFLHNDLAEYNKIKGQKEMRFFFLLERNHIESALFSFFFYADHFF